MSRPEHVTVILNPASSGGRGARLRPQVEHGLTQRGIAFSLVQTEGAGHAEFLARRAVGAETDSLLVVGGDGTIHEVANGILKGDPPPLPLAVVPVGTGNDFYRMLGKAGNVEAALNGLTEGVVRPFDVGRVRSDGGQDAFFVNLLGMGVDVEVLRKRKDFSRLGGLPQYLAALTSALTGFRATSFRVSVFEAEGEAGGEMIEDRTLLAAFTVGPSVGGGFLLNPSASPYDGLLDLFFIRTLGIFKLGRYIPRVIRGTHEGIPELTQRKIRKATVRRTDGEPFLFEMDGELTEAQAEELSVEACPGLLPVMVPGSRR